MRGTIAVLTDAGVANPSVVKGRSQVKGAEHRSAEGLGPCPVGVPGFESPPPHHPEFWTWKRGCGVIFWGEHVTGKLGLG